MKAYRIDSRQFREFAEQYEAPLSKTSLENYCRDLHQHYKPRTTKRKIASAKAFCHWLEYEEIVEHTPFAQVHTKFRELQTLPRVISSSSVTAILRTAYCAMDTASSPGKYRATLRNTAVLEMMFATGMRVSELCHLTGDNVDLIEGKVRVYGKGSKERIVQIGNTDTLKLLRRYHEEFGAIICATRFFFLNSRGQRLSEQSVRQSLDHIAKFAGVAEKVTPHMFRHTVTTLLLEAGVDIRHLQQFLGTVL